MKKKVLHVITELDIGGAEKQLSVLLPKLQRKFTNHVACLSGQGHYGKVVEQGGTIVHYLDSRGYWDLTTYLKLFRLIKQVQPQIVITYLIQADIMGRLAARAAGVKHLISSQRSSLVGREYLRLADRLTKSLVSSYTVQTPAMRDHLVKRLGLSPTNFTIIPNAITPLPLKMAQSIKYTNITCVSNFKPGKDQATLLKAFARLAARYPLTRLHFVGTGPEEAGLKTMAEALIPERRVTFHGQLSNVSKLLQKSHIFVLPSRGEGMSNALLEAMAQGLACVASNIPANRALLSHDKTGLLFATGDPLDAAHNLALLLENPALRIRLAKAARNRTTIYHNPDLIAHRWETLLMQHVS